MHFIIGLTRNQMQNYKVFALFFAFQACFFGHAIGAVMGLCVCFCLIYDVCSNGYIKTDLDSLGIFMLRICCFMAGGGINKALAERKKKQPNSEAVN